MFLQKFFQVKNQFEYALLGYVGVPWYSAVALRDHSLILLAFLFFSRYVVYHLENILFVNVQTSVFSGLQIPQELYLFFFKRILSLVGYVLRIMVCSRCLHTIRISRKRTSRRTWHWCTRVSRPTHSPTGLVPSQCVCLGTMERSTLFRCVLSPSRFLYSHMQLCMSPGPACACMFRSW